MSNVKLGNNYNKLVAELTTAQGEICNLMSQAIENASVRYENSHLIKCWETKNCGKKDCPSYKSENLRCWQVAGTFCGGKLQGTFAQKYGNCKECDVFRAACATEADTIGEQFNNLLHLLQEKVKKVDSLNKELLVVESLILQAATKPQVRYENNELSKCWELKKCAKKDCAAYENENLRCWQIVGTFCGEEVEGEFARKLGNCQECEVFQAACQTEASAIGEHFNNMMHLIQRKKEKTESLNNELLHALDSLDRKNSEILRLTITDNLTGLYNRSHLFECLKNELERTRRYDRPLSLLVIDIDGFKGYNDTYGHMEGDVVLENFGEIIKNSVRSTDIACRFGGDEFVLILPETDQTIALVVGERIRNTLRNHPFFPKQGKNKTLPVNKTASIGIASFSNNDTLEELIERADKAMYRAKQEGGDKVIF
jgi:diguanylate cyclase (GGDEF)-like protein